MLLSPTPLALLPFLILTALPITTAAAQNPPPAPATGYAFCSAADLKGACQYVASTMAGFTACNALRPGKPGSLQVWEGTTCTVSLRERCECGDDAKDDDECEVVEGPRLLKDLSVYRIGGKGPERAARGFSCEVAG